MPYEYQVPQDRSVQSYAELFTGKLRDGNTARMQPAIRIASPPTPREDTFDYYDASDEATPFINKEDNSQKK